MASRASKFLIGLFVIIGSVMAAITIIWVGAADFFTKGSVYVTYFDESVQGLQVDSAVKYRGVDVGKVQSIKVAPDGRLIEVVMKVDLSTELQSRVEAQLRTAGITGIVFIELDQIRDSEKSNALEINFEPDYPVIPSRRSEISRFLEDTNEIMESIKAIDFKGLSDQLKETTLAVENFIGGRQTTGVMKNLESTTANIDRAMESLRLTMENLQSFSERINENPSELFLRRPPPPKKIME
ncbi:MAG TPA: MlaD family protein [Smithellaceae bacterium]|nr:MlaD family protein [Smithellaceae bacterium]HNT90084.1 MlaD family protein [Smithellaceae bacterium]HNV65149.1 MlaD family protein [Smithellaceae bacterium]HNZ31753.1 MlaD family protein [Smithellaceae bacterium]HOF78025.1 MlaD family protein [Smithellaceae bacterium]